MKRDENQTVEYKASWQEKYLEWICGYANAKGGVLYVAIQERQDVRTIGSSRRNPVVADVFNRLNYAERRGSGLKKILDAYGAAEYNVQHRTPSFASDTFFTVMLPSLTYGMTKEQLIGGVPPVMPPDVTPVATPVMTPVATPVASRVDARLSDRQLRILVALSRGEKASSEVVDAVDGIATNNLRRRYMRYLLDIGYVEYTIPGKPNSRLQKYRLTARGRAILPELVAGGGK